MYLGDKETFMTLSINKNEASEARAERASGRVEGGEVKEVLR